MHLWVIALYPEGELSPLTSVRLSISPHPLPFQRALPSITKACLLPPFHGLTASFVRTIPPTYRMSRRASSTAMESSTSLILPPNFRPTTSGLRILPCGQSPPPSSPLSATTSFATRRTCHLIDGKMLDHSIVDRSPHRPHHRTRGTHRYRVPLASQTPGDGNTTSKGDRPAYCDSFYPPTKSGLPLHDGDVCSETFSVHCYSTNWGHRHP
jgi:hypothetical protein